jgi:hypothetical protein
LGGFPVTADRMREHAFCLESVRQWLHARGIS